MDNGEERATGKTTETVSRPKLTDIQELITTKKHLSVTQLKMYLRCPLQYKYRYIDGLKIPPTSSLTWASLSIQPLKRTTSRK